MSGRTQLALCCTDLVYDDCSSVAVRRGSLPLPWRAFCPPPWCRAPSRSSRRGAGSTTALSRRLGSQTKQALNLGEATSLPPLPVGLAFPQNTFLEQERSSQEPGSRSKTGPSSEPVSSRLSFTFGF